MAEAVEVQLQPLPEKTTMKLGYLCHPRIFQTGGPGGRTAGLLAAIAELGHEVHVRSDAVPHGLDVVTHRADTDGLECIRATPSVWPTKCTRAIRTCQWSWRCTRHSRNN